MGRYEGQLITLWDGDGRHMWLTAPFSFIDCKSLRWGVPSEARIDGASIPAFLWPFTGSPYTGKYRDASVVHDWYCSVRTRTSKATHRMFHEAMLVSGVSLLKANWMYAGVRYAGPRWSDMDIHNANVATGGRWSGNDFQGDGLSDGDGGVDIDDRPDGGGFGGAAADFGSITDLDELDAATEAFAKSNFVAATVPVDVSEREFARLAERIVDGPMDLDNLDREFDPPGREMRPLPLGVYPFVEMKQLAEA